MVLPLVSFESLHGILGKLYDDMMPLCDNMTSVASAIAGIGAMLYICYRVWKAIANAEPIDLFPLLRPFALGICIVLFQSLVLGGINGILSPIVKGTNRILTGGRIGYLGSHRFLHFGLRRLPSHPFSMARQIYFGLPVASDSRPFRGRTFASSSAVFAAGHGTDGHRSFLRFRCEQRGVSRLHDYRHLRLFYYSERGFMDRAGGRFRFLQPYRNPYGVCHRPLYRRRSRSFGRQHLGPHQRDIQ